MHSTVSSQSDQRTHNNYSFKTCTKLSRDGDYEDVAFNGLGVPCSSVLIGGACASG
jgi:hypothetical protein